MIKSQFWEQEHHKKNWLKIVPLFASSVCDDNVDAAALVFIFSSDDGWSIDEDIWYTGDSLLQSDSIDDDHDVLNVATFELFSSDVRSDVVGKVFSPEGDAVTSLSELPGWRDLT